MKAVIRLDVPDWQIGQPVTVFFKDTMQKNGFCEKEQEETVEYSKNDLEKVKPYSISSSSVCLLNNAITPIKCRNCNNGGMDSSSYPQYWCSVHSEYVYGDYFCASGVKKRNE